MNMILLICCLILGLLAIVGSLVSALSYTTLFIVVAVLGLLSAFGFVYLAWTSTAYRLYAYVLILLPLYALFDIALRYGWGIRVLDFILR